MKLTLHSRLVVGIGNLGGVLSDKARMVRKSLAVSNSMSGRRDFGNGAQQANNNIGRISPVNANLLKSSPSQFVKNDGTSDNTKSLLIVVTQRAWQ